MFRMAAVFLFEIAYMCFYLCIEATADDRRYWAFKSQYSIDGLPGMKRGYEYGQKNGVKPLKKWKGKWAPKVFGPRHVEKILPVHLFAVALLSLVIGGLMALTMVPVEVVRRVQAKELFV